MSVPLNVALEAVTELQETVESLEVENERLQDRANELTALEYAGVDNWVGYSHSFEIMKEDFPETYKRKFGDE